MTGTVAARRGTLELLAAARVRTGTRAGNGRDLGKDSKKTKHPPKEYSEAAKSSSQNDAKNIDSEASVIEDKKREDDHCCPKTRYYYVYLMSYHEYDMLVFITCF
jgi:hypothetical protein